MQFGSHNTLIARLISSGYKGQGVAWASNLLGIRPATLHTHSIMMYVYYNDVKLHFDTPPLFLREGSGECLPTGFAGVSR